MITKLDYSLQTPEERKQLVEKILLQMEEKGEKPSSLYLEKLADYLVLCMNKEEKKQKTILTENHLQVINSRETSLEGLCASFENGEDSLHPLIKNDKNIIFRHKVTITKKDLQNIPELEPLRASIEFWEQQLKSATGRDAYTIKSTIIEQRKDQYVIKDTCRKPIVRTIIPAGINTQATTALLDISFTDMACVSAILSNYSCLKEKAEFEKGDLWFLLSAFDNLLETALRDYPIYQRLLELKTNGLQNIQIQEALSKEFHTRYTVEYISTLWRNKIPKLIASSAEDEYLNWYYLNVEKGKYKRCSRCGQIKLAHNKYFSKNKTAKDGFYSICKKCRNNRAHTPGQI